MPAAVRPPLELSMYRLTSPKQRLGLSRWFCVLRQMLIQPAPSLDSHSHSGLDSHSHSDFQSHSRSAALPL